ncbi:MAG: hypothetical protein LBE91_04870 [Tannerella sp.]|nr:hypothetical protein [Tannerella sp.]
MTHLAIKGQLTQYQINAVFEILNSWNIEAEIMDISKSADKQTLRREAAHRANGLLHKYANNALVEKEKEAWANHVKEKYDNI